jgi:hypothetical protein
MASKYLNAFKGEENRKRLAKFFLDNREYAKEDYFILRGFSHIIRDYTDYISPAGASRDALKIAKKYNINLGKVNKKAHSIKELCFEHKWPISQIIDECLKAKNQKAIQEILAKVEVVWITVDENKLLNKGDKNREYSSKIPEEYKKECEGKRWKDRRPPNAYELLKINIKPVE